MLHWQLTGIKRLSTKIKKKTINYINYKITKT